MAGYSATPLWKKLGYKNGTCAYVEGAPQTYVAELRLPSAVSVRWAKAATTEINFVHLFVSRRSGLRTKLESFRFRMVPNGVIWVSWPKKSSGVVTDLTEDMVREAALPLGLVDVKVCAVNEVWSGLKLMIRKKLR
jgi:hypothetical protein